MPSTALFAKPWQAEHFSPGATVSRNGGCAMHGVDRCIQPAMATVVYPTESNGACEEWLREHPEVEWRQDE